MTDRERATDYKTVADIVVARENVPAATMAIAQKIANRSRLEDGEMRAFKIWVNGQSDLPRFW